MTKMYIDRAVVEQALEFVTSEAWGTTPYMDMRVYEAAARLRDVLQAALRAAPAQQAEPVEPVAWRTFDGEGGYEYRSYEDNEGYADAWVQRNPNHVGWVEALYTPLSKTEPVAWMYKGEPWFDGTRYHDKYEVTTDERLARFKDENARPLYFAP